MADELFPLRCRAYETGNACSLHEKTTGCENLSRHLCNANWAFMYRLTSALC